LHIEEVNRRLARQYGFKNGIADCLDRVFYSQEVGHRKPGEEIFHHALREMNWQPADTLFIEDSPQHIATARRLGLRVLYLAPPLTLTAPNVPSPNGMGRKNGSDVRTLLYRAVK
jgi:glucose-1-phosphatase